MNRLTLESNVGVVSPKHLSASPISSSNLYDLFARRHKAKSGLGFFQSDQDFASFFVRGRRLKSERASVKERLLSRPKIKQRRSGRTDAFSKCTSLSSPPPSLTTRFPGPIRHRSDAARKARKRNERAINHSFDDFAHPKG